MAKTGRCYIISQAPQQSSFYKAENLSYISDNNDKTYASFELHGKNTGYISNTGFIPVNYVIDYPAGNTYYSTAIPANAVLTRVEIFINTETTAGNMPCSLEIINHVGTSSKVSKTIGGSYNFITNVQKYSIKDNVKKEDLKNFSTKASFTGAYSLSWTPTYFYIYGLRGIVDWIVPEYSVTGTVFGEGEIIGLGTYENETSITLTARSKNNYTTFSHWENGDTNPIRKINSIDSNVAVQAYFISKCQIIGNSVPAEGGSVLGAGTKEVNKNIVLEAIPNSGWHFTHWNTGIITPKITIQVPQAERYEITAYFEKDKVNQIYIGPNLVKEIYVGDKPVKAIYVGDKLIYGLKE